MTAGIIIMLILCYLDYSMLIRWAFPIWGLLQIAIVYFVLCGNTVNGRSLTAMRLAFFIVPFYAGVVYKFRNEKWKGLLKSIVCLGITVISVLMVPDLSSAIIEGELYVRSRLDGDKYRTRGMTRRLKTMLHDSGIPKGERDRIPIFCDARGIVFVPALGAREDLGSSPNGDRLFLLLPIDGR